MSRRSFDEDDAELDTLLQDGRPSIKPSTSSSFTKRKSSSKGRPTRTSNWLWLISGIILAFASLALVLTAVPEDTCRTLAGTKSDKKVSTTVGSRVFFRVGGISKEGVGSAIQRFKESIILSEAMNSSLILSESESEHRYLLSRLINQNIDNISQSADVRRACTVSDYLPKEERKDLVRGWCDGDETAVATMRDLGKRMEHCNSILDLNHDEITQDLNGCVQSFLRHRLGSIPPLPKLSPTILTIGIHIRWGDSAGKFRGSMHMENINRILSDVRTKWGDDRIKVSIAMENSEKEGGEEVLKEVKVKEFRLLDSGDGMEDLKQLGGNDLLLVGTSSYGVLAHLLAPKGLTIYEEYSKFGELKYSNTSGYGRPVFKVKEYTPATLDLLGL